VGVLLAVVLAAWMAFVAPAARALPTPSEDPFYRYAGSTPLASIAPGSVLKTRTLSYHVAGVPLPVTAVQLLYRSTGAVGQPTVNVTSVLLPLLRLGTPTVVSYQSFYDSLNNEDEPSYAISGGVSLGGLIPDVESAIIAPALLAGDAVVVSDTEGEEADFSAGPVYGMNTLDALRAALASPATGLAGTQEIGLIGYSGGAIATEWAAELAPSYAPGPGDGVMIAGDVRSLAREYCSRGVTVQYEQYEDLSHVPSALVWLPEAYAWLAGRFLGSPAPQNCAQIAPGNSLEPIP